MELSARLFHHLIAWKEEQDTSALELCTQQGLRPESFFTPQPNGYALQPSADALIYRIIIEYFNDTGTRIPILELNQRLRTSGAPTDILSESNSVVAAAAVSASNGSDIESIVEAIRKNYSSASLKATLTEVVSRERDLIDTEPEQVREKLINALQETVTADSSLVTAINSPEAIQKRIDGYGSRVSNANRGVLLGFRDFDREVGGLNSGELTLIAGQAKAGKSAFCLTAGLQIIDHAEQCETDCHVLFANREMQNDRQKERIEAWFIQKYWSREGDGKLTRRIRDGALDSDELMVYAAVMKEMAAMHNKIWMADPRSYETLDELEGIIARYKKQHPIKVVIVDALNDQALSRYGSFVSSQWQAMEQVTRRLERIASRHQIVVIAEAQEKTDVGEYRNVRLEELFADASQIRRPISYALRLWKVPEDPLLVEAQMVGSRFCQSGWSFPLVFNPGDMVIEDAPPGSREKIDALCEASRKRRR